jgi:uncharacterized membrane protein YfcA
MPLSENFVFVTTFCSLIIFVAFFIRSLTGFGSAIVSIPLLALLFDLKFAVPLEALFEVAFSVLLLSRVYKSISKFTLIPLIIGTIIGSLLGTYILYVFPNIYLKKSLGLVIIVFALNLLMGKTVSHVKPISSRLGVLAGTAGGVFGGLFGISGPAFVIYLTYKLKKKDVLRASLIGLFAIDYSWRICVYATTGLLTMETLKFSLILTPSLVLGTILGHKSHFLISEKRFIQVTGFILIVSGISLLVK